MHKIIYLIPKLAFFQKLGYLFKTILAFIHDSF